MSALNFDFPYKIYGNHDHILRRVGTAWGSLEGNLGILLNGIKGTGKTVSAQLLANWAIGLGIPVLLVTHPIPLTTVLEFLDQPVVIIFDEFEKTHEQKQEQHALLTALDGMARSRHKRMYIFTTNTKTVDDNFIDRPSRIRYCWEFKRLTDDVLDDLIADILRPDLAHLGDAIRTYLTTRKILSIDVAKTVINEVNTFREAPEDFADILNLTEMDATGFTLEALNNEREPVRTLTQFFMLRRAENNRLRNLLTRSGRDAYVNDVLAYDDTWTFAEPHKGTSIEILEPTDRPDEWVCHVKVSAFDTWIGKLDTTARVLGIDSLWIDERPEDWQVPEWARKLQSGVTLSDEEDQAKRDWYHADTLFGSDEKKKFLVRITPNYETVVFTKFGNFSTT
jgi:SpoVK/Ycf46/Vps4 family AAA+-type ATPase